MPRWLWATLFVLLAALWWLGRQPSAPAPATTAAGAPVACVPPARFTDPDTPLQSPVDGRMPRFRLDRAEVTPLAGFSLQARVLSREDYRIGAEADYSPTDLALGWGPMTAPDLPQRLHIRQGGRWYQYRWGAEGPPLPPAQIVANSANMHMVPADRTVAAALAQVNAGDTVTLDGWLVRIDRDDGWHWQSSLSRTDSGGGACELVYVCSISVR